LIHRGQPVRAPFEDDVDLQDGLWERSEGLAGLLPPPNESNG
jgi:hypothetical protein